MDTIPSALFTPGFLANPLPTFEFLRDYTPICYVDSIQAWAILRYKDAITAMRDRRLARANPDEPLASDGVPLLSKFYADAMPYTDLARHTRLRTILHKSFPPAFMKDLEASAEQIIQEMLLSLEGRKEIEFIDEFCDPLPAYFIARIIGIERSDWPYFCSLSHAIKSGLAPSANSEAQLCCNTALQSFNDLVFTQLDRRRKQPANDLLSALIDMDDNQGGKLSEQELASNCLLMLVAGHEAITSLMANGMLALLNHPDQLTKLLKDPGLALSAVDEMARHGRPMQMIPRYVMEDMEMGGQSFKRGQDVVVFLGSANHDPEIFSDPEIFDISRNPNPHLGFGYGIHFCFGTPLVRILCPPAFNAFLNKYPGVRLTPRPLAYLDTLQDNALKELRLDLN